METDAYKCDYECMQLKKTKEIKRAAIANKPSRCCTQGRWADWCVQVHDIEYCVAHFA